MLNGGGPNMGVHDVGVCSMNVRGIGLSFVSVCGYAYLAWCAEEITFFRNKDTDPVKRKTK